MKKNIMALSLLIVTSSFSITVDDIMKRAHLNSYYQGNDGRSQILMKIYSKKDSNPIKKLFYMLRLDKKDGGEQLFYTYFIRPSDIKRTSFLVHKKIDADDFRRLYIPASDKVLAIAGSRKQDPFMGSDFSYEDVSGRHYLKDNHTLIEESKLDSKPVYITQSIPKIKETKIKSIKAWISKKDFTPLKVEYTNHDGKVFKRYQALKSQVIDGFHTTTKRLMESPLTGSYTEMLINPKKTQYNIGLRESDFSQRSLKNPSMKYLK
ncbi:MAG: outer membrane lipoprotein-sorting protein [Bacteriovoracaceae bacterium]|jgi:hypothetical protein|nr:outer membrane lipoprotein-sorting protein [Bacteriovoracaceae bacterium]